VGEDLEHLLPLIHWEKEITPDPGRRRTSCSCPAGFLVTLLMSYTDGRVNRKPFSSRKTFLTTIDHILLFQTLQS
jgi:hypothetical protein